MRPTTGASSGHSKAHRVAGRIEQSCIERGVSCNRQTCSAGTDIDRYLLAPFAAFPGAPI